MGWFASTVMKLSGPTRTFIFRYIMTGFPTYLIPGGLRKEIFRHFTLGNPARVEYMKKIKKVTFANHIIQPFYNINQN